MIQMTPINYPKLSNTTKPLQWIKYFKIKLCPLSKGSTYPHAATFSHDLDIAPLTSCRKWSCQVKAFKTVNNEWDIMVLQVKWKKYEKKTLKVKGQGQMSPTSNHFWRSPWDIFLPNYINFKPVVFETLCEQIHKTDGTKIIIIINRFV